MRINTLLIAATLQATMPQAAAMGSDGLQSRPKVAVVLSGGGALGYAHIGVMQVLHELRVPVDCVVGTSMGALVGGSYAAGLSPQQMDNAIGNADIAALFDDQPARSEITQRIKRDDYSILFDMTMGFNNGAVQLPSGASAAYKFELFWKELIGIQTSTVNTDFDSLPTPYRAVATDLETGDMKVFARGELPKVMRASVSLPGIVSPAEIDGRIYVDGGLVSNLPVEAGRKLCGDVVIAVNVTAKPLTREAIHNSIDVSLQSITLLIGQNAKHSQEALTPRDILIVPELEAFSSSSFAEQQPIIKQGVEAALAQKHRLTELALSPEQYEEWLSRRNSKIPKPLTVTRITAETSGAVDADTILRDVRTKAGEDFSLRDLHKDIVDIYGRGDFSYVGYSVVPDGKNATVVVKAESKPWGPGYLKFGFGGATDFSSPTQLNLGASHRRTWVNSLGAEWRNDIQIGYDSFLKTEFTQPLQLRDGAFIAPSLSARRHFIEYYLGEDRLGHYNVKRARAGLDFGVTGNAGELSIAPYISDIESEPNFGLLNLAIARSTHEQSGWELNGILDQLDRPQFPRSGLRARINLVQANVQDADEEEADEYTRAQADITGVASFDKHTMMLHYERGEEISGVDQLPSYDRFQLGGPNRLSGLYLNQLTGSRYKLATLSYYRQYAELPPQLGTGMYFGFSLEAGEIDDPLMEIAEQRINSANAFWAADTILGDLYIGYGYSSTLKQGSWYLVIGPQF